MDESIARFWDKYIELTITYNVPDRARRWYIFHVEAFIKAHSGRRLGELNASHVESYPKIGTEGIFFNHLSFTVIFRQYGHSFLTIFFEI